MSDILYRLRNPAWCHAEVPFESPQLAKEEVINDMNEAANEIERLQALITKLIDERPVPSTEDEELANKLWGKKGKQLHD